MRRITQNTITDRFFGIYQEITGTADLGTRRCMVLVRLLRQFLLGKRHWSHAGLVPAVVTSQPGMSPRMPSSASRWSAMYAAADRCGRAYPMPRYGRIAERG